MRYLRILFLSFLCVTVSNAQIVSQNAAASTAVTILSTVPAEFTAWMARIVSNSGTTPSVGQQNAVIIFINGCKADGIWTDMLWCDIFCPTATSVTTALTPLTVGTGALSLRSQVGDFSAQVNDLKGLHGNGSTLMIATGLQPSLVWSSDDDAGVSMIIPDFNGSVNPAGIEFGAYGAGGVNDIFIAAKSSGNSSGAIWDGVHSVAVVASPGVGYYAIDRIASNDLKMFFGKTGTPVAQLGTTQAAPGGTRWSSGAGFDLRYFAIVFAGAGPVAPSSSYISFACGHKGWTVTKELLLFARANTLRVAFGGGNI